MRVAKDNLTAVTGILEAVECGNQKAAEELLPLVYDELRRLAAWHLTREKPGQTLQATALVHEAWLRVAGSGECRWDGRKHFFCAAAEAMRRILVENARRKQAAKHGGGHERVNVEELELAAPLPDEELLALDEALTQFAEVDRVAAALVNLRFFAGLTQAQAAEQLGISRSTADRNWVFARAWLFERVRGPAVSGARARNVPSFS